MSETNELTETVLGRYRLLAELGTGGMANVYLAALRGSKRGSVAFTKLLVLKILRHHLAQDPGFLEMFSYEAGLAARLNHPNVVQTFEVGEECGRHLIVMEYLDGRSLADVLDRCRAAKTPMPLAMHLRILSDAMSGLHHAHELADFDGTALQLVHRDISPPNVFVTFDGQVKVLDFGIAKATTSPVHTETGVLKGKIRYMAPEQFDGKADRRADIFALGVMLWEAAAREPLWKDRSEAEILNRVINGVIPSPRAVEPSVSELLDAACRKALSHDRDDRHATCLELQADVERAIDELGGAPSTVEIGAYLDGLFRDTRAIRRRTVERELARIENDDAPHSLITDPLPSFAYASQSTAPRPNVAERPSRHSELPIAAVARSRIRAWAAGMAALVAALSVAVWIGRGATHRAPAVPRAGLSQGNAANATSPADATGATPAVASATPSADPSRDVLVTIAVEPRSGRIFFDDVALPANPAVTRSPRGPSQHWIRAEAPGYVTKSLSIALASDQSVVIDLDRAPPVASAPRPSSSQPPPKPAPPIVSAPVAVEPPVAVPSVTSSAFKRPLDKSNPWE